MFFSGDGSPRENGSTGRENSSITNRNLHPTYFQKPKPALQMLSQNSHLDEKGRTSNAFRNPGNPEDIPAVPTTWDTVYDPEHPDADWSGLVKKLPHKKHISDHIAMKEGIERNEYGIISKEERQEWARKRTNTDLSTSKNAGSIVIAGVDNPDERYKTSYRRFETQERTGRDQLTLDKRQNPIKKIQDPAQAHFTYQPSFNESPRELNYSMNSTNKKDGIINPRASLLSNIGEKLFQDFSLPPNPKQPRPNENYRVLITDNYNPAPGYTGGRKL